MHVRINTPNAGFRFVLIPDGILITDSPSPRQRPTYEQRTLQYHRCEVLFLYSKSDNR